MKSHRKTHLTLLLATQQLSLRTCSGFASLRCRPNPGPRSLSFPIDGPKQLFENPPSTAPRCSRLFASEHDDGEKTNKISNENSDAYTNDLDIFGQPKQKQKKKSTSFFSFDDDESEIQGPDRIKSCIPYALVLIDGDSFGRYIYERIPPLGTLDYVFLRPIVDAFRAAPILSILLFTAFALGPRFTGQSRSVRFNAQQAVLMDVALIFPTIIGDSIEGENVARALVEPCTNFVWYAYVTGVFYCVICNLRGKKPDGIPFFSQAAEMAIGPF